jgi:hypothetical protein
VVFGVLSKECQCFLKIRQYEAGLVGSWIVEGGARAWIIAGISSEVWA